MKNIIKVKDIEDILQQIESEGFSPEGCSCGDWGYSISEDIHLYAHRSCHKSSNTPRNKWWHISDIEIFSKINKGYEEYEGEIILLFAEIDEEDEITNIKLDDRQEEIIMNKLIEISKSENGKEYK